VTGEVALRHEDCHGAKRSAIAFECRSFGLLLGDGTSDIPFNLIPIPEKMLF
jgi:hypothetical protein